MVSRIRPLFLAVLFFSLALLPLFSSAHELIPKVVLEYVTAHPNATPEEIQEYAKNAAPIFASKFKNADELLKIIRNQKTSFLDNVWNFLQLGVKHILSGPDHIFFVLSLLLVFSVWKDILRLTASFTVAHSITLVLAGSNLLRISSKIVEPMIALSIAYMALSTVFLRGTRFERFTKKKWITVFFFGLFHGLGFAGLLQELSIPSDKFISSLFSFNVGIEVGQLIIVASAFPLLYWLRPKVWYERVIRGAALIIGAAGIFWFIQRIFF